MIKTTILAAGLFAAPLARAGLEGTIIQKMIPLVVAQAVQPQFNPYTGEYNPPQQRTVVVAKTVLVHDHTKAHKKAVTPAPDAKVTVVDNETDADATHIYLDQQGSNDSGMTKMTYDDNPKAFTQGWRDGWKWASKQSDFSSDQPAEDVERDCMATSTRSRGKPKR
jgi:hypothetical protein